MWLIAQLGLHCALAVDAKSDTTAWLGREEPLDQPISAIHSCGECAGCWTANQVNENLSGSWYVAPTVSEDAGKTTQPGDKRSGCWTRCKTRRRYTPTVIEPEISTGQNNPPMYLIQLDNILIPLLNLYLLTFHGYRKMADNLTLAQQHSLFCSNLRSHSESNKWERENPILTKRAKLLREIEIRKEELQLQRELASLI